MTQYITYNNCKINYKNMGIENREQEDRRRQERGQGVVEAWEKFYADLNNGKIKIKVTILNSNINSLLFSQNQNQNKILLNIHVR